MKIQTVNPATNKVVKEFKEMTPEEIEKALSTAALAFDSWRRTPYKRRTELLHKVAELMRKKKTELSELITVEMGKLIGESEDEIDLSADIFDYYAKMMSVFWRTNRWLPNMVPHLSDTARSASY
jgi:succinate-semialdehyde dehydrogenase / glutarate-semialdehyde dehydrogenase